MCYNRIKNEFVMALFIDDPTKITNKEEIFLQDLKKCFLDTTDIVIS